MISRRKEDLKEKQEVIMFTRGTYRLVLPQVAKSVRTKPMLIKRYSILNVLYDIPHNGLRIFFSIM